MNDFYLSLGSNIDPEDNLIQAVKELGRFGSILTTSTIWETAPIGITDQPNYLNAVIHLQSSWSAHEFQDKVIPEVETMLKRVRGPEKFGPRTIDINILMFNDDILKLGHRIIPSDEILERPFVAIPLAEIAPHIVHPATKDQMKDIAANFSIDPEVMFERNDLTFTL